jgi:hypothetical protein
VRGRARSERRCLERLGSHPSPGPGARARPYRSGDAEGHGGTGEAVHHDVSLGDSEAIRVRVRAWEPGRIGVAEPRVPAGRGDPCTAGGKEVAASGGPCRRGDVLKWSNLGPSDRAGVAVAPRAGPERVGAREKALPEELGCGMRMEGAHRHETKK